MGDVVQFTPRQSKTSAETKNEFCAKEFLKDEVVLDFMESMLDVLFAHDCEYNSDTATHNMAAITIMFMAHLYPEKYPQLAPMFYKIRQLAHE